MAACGHTEGGPGIDLHNCEHVRAINALIPQAEREALGAVLALEIEPDGGLDMLEAMRLKNNTFDRVFHQAIDRMAIAAGLRRRGPR